MNFPFGNQESKRQWLSKFFEHGSGIALTPDRTSAPWWQEAAQRADAVLFTAGKIKFIRPDGSRGDSPSNGTALWASGTRATKALYAAQDAGLGAVFEAVR